MKDQFVTYEIAKRMKELGFDEPCFAYFILEDLTPIIQRSDYTQNSNTGHEYFAAPLWQQAIDWLREEHKIYVNFSTTIGECELQVSVTDNNTKRQSYADTFRLYEWSNPLEAKEHAILKALELIENKG